jgi:hypothetical protein
MGDGVLDIKCSSIDLDLKQITHPTMAMIFLSQGIRGPRITNTNLHKTYSEKLSFPILLKTFAF